MVAFHIRWTISDSLKAAQRTNCQFWKHDCSFPWLPYSQGIRERERERGGGGEGCACEGPHVGKEGG